MVWAFTSTQNYISRPIFVFTIVFTYSSVISTSKLNWSETFTAFNPLSLISLKQIKIPMRIHVLNIRFLFGQPNVVIKQRKGGGRGRQRVQQEDQSAEKQPSGRRGQHGAQSCRNDRGERFSSSAYQDIRPAPSIIRMSLFTPSVELLDKCFIVGPT